MDTLRPNTTALIPWFLLPVLLGVALFAVTNIDCRGITRDASGQVKILYTSDVGGAIDPCG